MTRVVIHNHMTVDTNWPVQIFWDGRWVADYNVSGDTKEKALAAAKQQLYFDSPHYADPRLRGKLKFYTERPYS